MLGHREMNVDDYFAIVRRRFWLIIVPVLVLPVMAYVVSLLIPAKYTSTTTVLVDKPKVPNSIVTSIVDDTLMDRLGTMQQRILSRTKLEPIIQRFGLYKELINKAPMEDIVDAMRKDVQVVPVKSISAKAGEVPGFTVSYTADTPRLAQQVCQEITSMFIEENIKFRADKAAGTTQFLDKQVAEAKEVLDDRDRALAAFKAKYIGALPGTEGNNMQILMGLNSQLDAATSALNRAQQDKTYTQSQLDQAIHEWQASQAGNNPQTLQQQLAAAQSQLIVLQGRYTDDHPDIIKQKADIAQIQKKIAEDEKNAKDKPATTTTASQLAEPPNVKMLRNQIYQYEQIIRDATKKQEQLQESIKTYRSRVEISPLVEEQYKNIMRDYQMAQEHYDDLLKRNNTAKMSKELEIEQQSEQFKVMDPANLPEKPSFPNRLLFAAGGLVGGMGLGLGGALLLEMRDKSIRSERDVEALLQLPTLAMIPSLVPGTPSSTGFFARFRKSPEQAGA